MDTDSSYRRRISKVVQVRQFMGLYGQALILLFVLQCNTLLSAELWSKHYVLLYPNSISQEQAQEYLDHCEQFRATFVKEWLNGSAPSDKTIIVIQEADRLSGFMWSKRHGARKYHLICIQVADYNTLQSVLNHEIVHTTLTNRRVPLWIDEGIASIFDCDELYLQRGKIKKGWRRAPNINRILHYDVMLHGESEKYAEAFHLIQYLLHRDCDNGKILRLGDDGQTIGWEAAFKKHYGVSLRQLQREWDNYVRE